MAWIAVVPHLAAQVWELSSWLLVEGDVQEARGVPKVCSPALNSSLPPCLGCTDVPRCSIHLSSWGEKRGSASAALSGKREKQGIYGQIKAFASRDGDAEVKEFSANSLCQTWQCNRTMGSGLGHWKGIISGGIKPISPLLVVLEHNSTCLNVDGFHIYSGAGEKREKIMHRVGGSWEEPPFSSFLPQFSMRNHVDSSFQPANANWDKLGGRLTNYCNVMVAVLQFSLQKAFNSQLSSSQLPFNW